MIMSLKMGFCGGLKRMNEIKTFSVGLVIGVIVGIIVSSIIYVSIN